eukprot:scaffold63407_cov63-Phaeocystis_antarctica.AAC.3
MQTCRTRRPLLAFRAGGGAGWSSDGAALAHPAKQTAEKGHSTSVNLMYVPACAKPATPAAVAVGM